MDLFEEVYEEPVLPLVQGDIHINLRDNEEPIITTEEDYAQDLYQAVVSVVEKVSQSSLHYHMIPYRITGPYGDDQQIWWMPGEHPVAVMIHTNPMTEIDPSSGWGDLIVHSDMSVNRGIDDLLELFQKYNLETDEKTRN